MNKREILNRILSGLLGAVIGITATLGIWYYKNIYQYNIGVVNKPDIKSFEKLDFWNKISYYYENELQIFFDSYESIYNTYSIYSYIDDSIKQYFEQYGIDAVLCSGLNSKNKLGQIYCIEKICEIAGEERINKQALLSALEKTHIDDKLYTDEETEKNYIELSNKRKNLAVALLNGSTENEEILSNQNKSRYVWISNAVAGNNKIRLNDNGFYYSLEDNIYIENLKKSSFISENCLNIKNKNGTDLLVIFDRQITVVDLNDEIRNYMLSKKMTEENSENIFSVQSMKNTDDYNIVGRYESDKYYDNSEVKRVKYEFTYDTKKKQISVINEIN